MGLICVILDHVPTLNFVFVAIRGVLWLGLASTALEHLAKSGLLLTRFDLFDWYFVPVFQFEDKDNTANQNRGFIVSTELDWLLNQLQDSKL